MVIGIDHVVWRLVFVSQECAYRRKGVLHECAAVSAPKALISVCGSLGDAAGAGLRSARDR
ncbi:hypothetical protein [Streptomyces sp. 7N604]|uniref:hypothetical protein n=1 Tax=Streptomyces sp. 7N604 TaxID=3457415 RepID=UPI003FD52B52